MEALQSILDNSRAYFLVCGFVNLAAAVFWAALTLIGVYTSCFLGCLLIFLPFIHLTVMIFDFIAVSRFSSPPTPGILSLLRFVAVLDILAGLVVLIPLIFGILNLLLLTKPEAHAHFHRAESV